MNQLRGQRKGCFVADCLRQNILSAVAFASATVLLVVSSFVIGAIDSRAAESAKPRADHWAFQAPVRPASTAVQDKSWPRTPIDAFILARLEKEALRPSPATDKITLLRRLHFDLTGVPPTIAETDDFLKDVAPDAYTRLVERLL